MQLKDYIPNLKKKFTKLFFSGIASDSLKVKKNFIFFAIKGTRFDGNDYIDEAIKNGAKIIISEKKINQKKNISYIHCSNVRKLLAEVSFRFLPKKSTKLVAVTGTNGKSSVADFYYQILNLNNKKVASVGTLGIKYNNKKKNVINTTLDPIKLSNSINNLVKEKIKYIIMEASSHGLAQHRLDGLLFDIGIFTNLSHDHLDYHSNMKNYLNAKLYLFKKLIKSSGYIITNAKIPELKSIKSIAKNKKINLKLIFNKKGIELVSHKFENEKQILKIRFKKKFFSFKLNLIGKLQIQNILMAVLAAEKSGIKFDDIVKQLNRIEPVEGRLEKIGKIKNNSKVILDYAHTPEALTATLLNLKEQFPDKKLNLLFGCGGERDFKKRAIMGSIANKYSDEIYLTDDNPRNETPSKIRQDIKKGIKKTKVYEISNREKAINIAINNLNTGELLLVAGKGHEKIQDYGTKKVFFSDKKIILNSIKKKNKKLLNDLKLNIIGEESQTKISKQCKIRKVSINSKNLREKDIFFAIKGEKVDGNKFIGEALKRKSSLAIVNSINKKFQTSKQIKVNNTLSFLTKCSSIFRDNVNAKIISITGSCGKTTLKEMIGLTLNKITKTSFSPKSYNNKYGVPLSLFNLNYKDRFGVFEVGMDKKGEIDALTRILKPDLGVITNISYAHSKNFKSIRDIAKAKAEIMNNIKRGGKIVLNMDDSFFNLHKKIALKKNLNVVSFGIDNRSAMIKLLQIKKINNKFKLLVKIDKDVFTFFSKNDFRSNLYNILATLASIKSFVKIENLKKDIFLNLETPNGRGDVSEIRLKNKRIFLVDETYNSNPLSLRIAIENFDRMDVKNSKKYLILGDMLELGKHSKLQHKLITKILNKTKIDRIYVIGNHIKETFKGLKLSKKAKILDSNFEIINLIKNNLSNNDYLMIKGSNSTGLNKLISRFKNRSLYVV